MLIQDTDIQEFIDYSKKRILFLLKGYISRVGWKYEDFILLIGNLSSFIISRDDAPEDRKKILERTIGREPWIYYDVITDLNAMEYEGSGGLRVEYPDGEVVSIVLELNDF